MSKTIVRHTLIEKYAWHLLIPYLYTFSLYENASFIIVSAETEYISTRSWYRNINFKRSRTGMVVGGFRLPIKGMADNPTWKPFNPTGEISKGTLQNQKCSGTCFWSIKTKVQVKCLHVFISPNKIQMARVNKTHVIIWNFQNVKD